MSCRTIVAACGLLPACAVDADAKGEPGAPPESAGKFDGGVRVDHGALVFGSESAGQLGTSTPLHRWSFALGGPSALDLRTVADGDGAVDTILYLFVDRDRQLALVDSDDDSGYGTLSRLRGSYDAGEYIAVATGYRRSTEGRFALTAGCTGEGCDGPAGVWAGSGRGLGYLGHRIAVAHDGPEALRIASEVAPHVALLDIGLRVVDGDELASISREQSLGVKLVAITGYGQQSDLQRSHDAGFHAHLTKPVHLDELASLLRTRTACNEDVASRVPLVTFSGESPSPKTTARCADSSPTHCGRTVTSVPTARPWIP